MNPLKFNILILIVILGTGAFGQSNLVLNPSFEESSRSSDGTRKLKKAGELATDWYSPLDKRSPYHYRSPTRSVAVANTGEAAIGMVLGSSKKGKTKYEYITGKVAKPLVKGQAYCVSFSVLLHRSSKYASSNIGVLLHHDKELIANSSNRRKLQATLYAHDGDVVTNTKWQEFNGYFVASGGEKYISFGMFGESETFEMKDLGFKPYFQMDGLQTKAFYQLDDVSVIAHAPEVECGCAEPPKQESDTIISSNELQPYLFALDASGSMKKNALFDSLRSNLVDLVSMLPKGTPVTFSVFSTNSDPVFSGILDENTAGKVDSLLKVIKLGGGTNVFEGLMEAAKSWKPEVKDSARIVLVSDGNFIVSNRIEAVVKREYEQKGRKLTVVQIESKAKNYEKLEPYETSFVSVAPSELRSAIFQIYETTNEGAIACECVDEYTDTMNYHFVIDYSGSMKLHKGRAMRALRDLYAKAPSSAVITITAFSLDSKQLFKGKKSDMTMDELDQLLRNHEATGGTDPAPGMKDGLILAQEMADKRFSHIILITDLVTDKLNENGQLKGNIKSYVGAFDMAVSSMAVDLGTSMDLLVSGRAQFDQTSATFREVSTSKFEKDLFESRRSSCDYTTQAYHYNPAKDIAKKEAKKVLRALLKEATGVGVSVRN